MIHTDRDRQRIGNVRRLRCFLQPKLQSDRLLHLMFWCMTIASHDFLDSRRFNRMNRRIDLRGSQTDRTAGMAH